MIRTASVAVALGLAGAGAPPAFSQALALRHQPVRCVVALTHPWIEAEAPGAVTVQARFRRADSREWYTVRLTEEEDGWKGALPPPTQALDRFLYYVEATDASAAQARTPEQAVRVVRDEAGCGTDGVGPSVPEAIVTAEGPHGGAALPKGFSAGQPEAAVERVGSFNMSPRTALVAGLGVAAAATTAALAAAGGSTQDDRDIEFLGSSPPPGSTISLGSLALSVRLRVSSNRDIGAGSVVIDLRPPGAPIGCVTLWTSHGGIGAGRPVEVVVERVLFVTCPAPFSAAELHAIVRGPGETDVFGERLPLSYSFVP